MRRVLLGICLLLLAGLGFQTAAARGPGAALREPPAPATPAQAERPAARPAHPEIGFATRQKFAEHYRKHGAEFGAVSREEYLRRAQQLRDRAAGDGVLEQVRADGVVTRFDRASGAFLAFNPDLTIRTFFKPNDGEAYFVRQSRRGTK